jgi:hypothetical protein
MFPNLVPASLTANPEWMALSGYWFSYLTVDKKFEVMAQMILRGKLRIRLLA